MNRTKTIPVAVIDYGAGNLRSVVRALSAIGAAPQATADPEVVRNAQIVVLPGVGATRDTMDNLHRLGMVDAIHAVVKRGVPFLGVCVGMQVLCDKSEEFGLHPCLGVVRGAIRRLPDGQKIPQIGWNQVNYADPSRTHPVFANIPDGSDFYFVHSYFCDLTESDQIAATTTYGRDFPSALIDERVVAVQFHPEKSSKLGLQLYHNFVQWASQLD
jgi:glutamine amidotransferase